MSDETYPGQWDHQQQAERGTQTNSQWPTPLPEGADLPANFPPFINEGPEHYGAEVDNHPRLCQIENMNFFTVVWPGDGPEDFRTGCTTNSRWVIMAYDFGWQTYSQRYSNDPPDCKLKRMKKSVVMEPDVPMRELSFWRRPNGTWDKTGEDSSSDIQFALYVAIMTQYYHEEKLRSAAVGALGLDPNNMTCGALRVVNTLSEACRDRFTTPSPRASLSPSPTLRRSMDSTLAHPPLA